MVSSNQLLTVSETKGPKQYFVYVQTIYSLVVRIQEQLGLFLELPKGHFYKNFWKRYILISPGKMYKEPKTTSLFFYSLKKWLLDWRRSIRLSPFEKILFISGIHTVSFFNGFVIRKISWSNHATLIYQNKSCLVV